MAPKISGVDQTETIVALQKRFGTSYILYGCKSQPRQALNIILTSWGKELPVLSLGSPVPDFRACQTVQDIFKAADLWLAEYEGKIVEEAETLAEEVERITAAAAALDAPVVTSVERTDVTTDVLVVAADETLDEALDRYSTVVLGSGEGEPVVIPAPTVDSLVSRGTFQGAVEFEGIPLTQLRKASKGGVVKNGYDKTRAELEDALYAAGVSRAKALAAK